MMQRGCQGFSATGIIFSTYSPAQNGDNQKVSSNSQCHEMYDSEPPILCSISFSYMSKREKIKEIKEDEYSSLVNLENDAMGEPEPGSGVANISSVSGVTCLWGDPMPSLHFPFSSCLFLPSRHTCILIFFSAYNDGKPIIKCLELTTD